MTSIKWKPFNSSFNASTSVCDYSWIPKAVPSVTIAKLLAMCSNNFYLQSLTYGQKHGAPS